MNRTLQDQLIEKGLAPPSEQKKLEGIGKSKMKKRERFSERELAELMGINRDRYRRVGGAVRRK